MNYFTDFEFDLPSALLEQLVNLFEKMGTGTLNEEEVAGHIPDEQGVYQLFLDNRLVYIGKTDADAGLQNRLRRHARKILARRHLDPTLVTFKAIRIYVFATLDLEELLIKKYKDNGTNPAWQHSGFGSNDPGRNRDTTILKDDHFDKLYPIDLETPIMIDPSPLDGPSVADVLSQMKNQLPFNIRFQNAGGRSRAPHKELTTHLLDIRPGSHTTRQLLEKIASAMGISWQVTALPGHVILYKESKEYPEGEIIRPTWPI